MKSQLLILLLLSLFAQKFCHSQETPDDIINRVNRANYIFEGRVIRSDSYWSQTQSQIYTSSTIEISKIVKGNLSCGTVEIITVGGKVGDSEVNISHNLTLSRGMMGVFLCDENIWESPVIDYFNETNTIPLWVPDGLEGFIRFYNDGVNDAVKDWQFSLDSLAQLYNLMGLFTTLNLVDCGGTLPAFNPKQKLPSLIAPTYPNNNLQIANQFALTATSVNTGIHFDYLNRHITSTTPVRYFEFDVALSDDIDTGYFYSGEFSIEYPTNIFGSNVVANSNVILSTTGKFSGTTAYILNPFDDTSANNKLVIQIIPDSTSFDSLVNLPNFGGLKLYPAIHVRIGIVDCFPVGIIGMVGHTPFVPRYWSSSPFYNSTATIRYDNSNLSTLLEFPSCILHIDNISASNIPITGGTGDTVSVSGLNFDTARGNGNVWVRTANDNGSYIHLDSIDYVSWNDSIIKFIMPGNGIYIDTTGSFGVAGSGRIRVQNNVGDTTSGDSTTVWYSIESAYYSSQNRKYMYNLGNVYSFQHGYEFMIDTTMEKNLHPDRWKSIDVAIKEWVCLSGVNFILGDTLTPRDYDAMSDTICRIQFGRTTSKSALAQTVVSSIRAPGCDRVFTEEIDIIIDSTRKDSLFWDINCHHDVPFGKYDAYSSILHELGHGHSLNHVNDSRDIMYWLDRGKYGIPANNRNIFIKFDPSAIDASNYVTTKAADPFLATSPGCLASLLGVRTIPDCDSLPRVTGCGPIWVEVISSSSFELRVIPNPALSNFEFVIKSNRFMSGFVEIKDIFGKSFFLTEKQNLSLGWNYIPIDVRNLSSGVYCIGIHTQEGSAFTKFIIE